MGDQGSCSKIKNAFVSLILNLTSMLICTDELKSLQLKQKKKNTAHCDTHTINLSWKKK